MEMMWAVLVACVVGLTCGLITGVLARPNSPIRILDIPNDRSLHAAPIPRTGGIAIVTTLFGTWALFGFVMDWDYFPLPILFGASIVAAISTVDDFFGLSAMHRLAVQFVAAGVLAGGGLVVGGELMPGVAVMLPTVGAVAVSIGFTLWLTNLYNFMDGMDGFAGGMAVIGFGTLAVLGWQQGDVLFSAAALVVSGAAAGFLWLNFPPARIFMGDSGSTTLGFLVAAFAVWGSQREVAPIWLTLVVFSPFVVDATVTLVKRAMRGEPVWRAHRSHYYQRLVRMGWGHRRTVLAEYGIMAACALFALVLGAGDLHTQWGILGIMCGLYAGAAVAIHRMEHKKGI